MLRLLTHQFRLPLRHLFTISRDSVSVQPTLIVELTDGRYRGFGEATTNAYYGMTMSRMFGAVERVRGLVESSHRIASGRTLAAGLRADSQRSLSPCCGSIRPLTISGENSGVRRCTSCGD